jgi:hypothetical protein
MTPTEMDMSDDRDAMPDPRPTPFVAAMVRGTYESLLMISAHTISKDPKFKEPKWVSEILDAASPPQETKP